MQDAVRVGTRDSYGNANGQSILTKLELACGTYLGGEFSAFSFLNGKSGSAGKERAKRLQHLAKVCCPENADFLLMAIQNMKGSKLIGSIHNTFQYEETTPGSVYKKLRDSFTQRIDSFGADSTLIGQIEYFIIAYLERRLPGKDSAAEKQIDTILRTPMLSRQSISPEWRETACDANNRLTILHDQHNGVISKAEAISRWDEANKQLTTAVESPSPC